MTLSIIDHLGRYTITVCSNIGRFTLFFITACTIACSTKPSCKKLFEQMEQIGVHSLSIALLTGLCAGAVLALQSYTAFVRFGAEEFIGPLVGMSMVRELGPVLTGLMVTGRAGSAMAAELGTMRITEQIDALQTLNINPFHYLVVPRILASCIVMPCVSLVTSLCGIVGGYLIALHVLELHSETYYDGIRAFVTISDILNGLIKASVFGLIIALVGCYKGYYASGGAHGVGIATTQAVVVSSILILLANYFLTAALFA